MRSWALAISEEVKNEKQGLSNEINVRISKAMESICSNPKIGDSYTNLKNTYIYKDGAHPQIQILYKMIPKRRRIEVFFISQKIVDSLPRISVFFSYSKHDETWFKKLEKEFSSLKDLNIDLWNDTNIPAGAKWHDLILEKVADAAGDR